jgi:OOP family OmpA-OmpF porin
MHRSRGFVLSIASVFAFTGCATGGGGSWICPLVGAVAGGTTGWLIRDHGMEDHEGEDATDEEAMAAAAGAIVGGAIGYFVCGGRRENQPPTARVMAEPRSGQPPLKVSFRGTGSDADGEITSYAWDFGDGSRSSEQHPSHSYARAGDYTATLTVTDDDGATGSASTSVQVAAAATRPAEGRRIVLRGINFAFDSARIEPEFEPVLDVAVDELQANPDISVEVAGHTDSTGADDYNQALSERRASSVVDYLVSKGIDRSRLAPTGSGESQPVADNGTRDGRAQNRRVELNVR